MTSRISRRFVLILALAQLLMIYAWIVEPNWIEVTSHEAWFKTLPEEFNGLVVAHLSDLHIRKYGTRERQVVARLAESMPGVIVITGDLTLEGSDPATIRQFLMSLRDLKPTFGIWAVLGNHDHWYPLAPSKDAIRQFYNNAGVALLVNEGGRIGRGLDTLSLIGVDIGALWLPAGSEPFESGWFYGQNARMYVTRGIGTSILPVRLFCRPELALITLKRSGPKR
ncbi:MAG: hypothetical protein E6K64_10905 [Nitrospirae bacterium]|nr:MAG: hypothetical protein E6K64_10905 [Nitrospirota bacterium]